MCDATSDQISNIISNGGVSKSTQSVLLAIRDSLSVQHGLRADSLDAPDTHAKAMARGPPWPEAISKEFGNHDSNESWRLVDRSTVPSGRKIHKFVWVFKVKRDGTAKARLCVQGCTLEEGIDFDQTFAKPLRHASARGFACLLMPRAISARFAALTLWPRICRENSLMEKLCFADSLQVPM